MTDGPAHPKQRVDPPVDTIEIPPARKFPLTRFEANVREAKLTSRGEYVVTIQVPWEQAEQAKQLMDYQGIMLDWRVTRKPV